MSGRSVAVLAVVGIGGFLYCAAPSCIHKARLYAPETAALSAVQTLNAAQVQYNSQFGRYARSLSELGPSAADLISADFAVGERPGYKFTLKSMPTGYTITAGPSEFWGSHTFYSDQSLVIRENVRPPAGHR